MCKHGMPCSHRVKGYCELCLAYLFIYLFIYLFVGLFIYFIYYYLSDIHSPFSKRSEVGLHVTG